MKPLRTPLNARSAGRRWLATLALGGLLGGLLVGCGGGGGGSASSASTAVAVSFPPSPASLQDSNVVPIVVEAAQWRNVNIPYVSVTVCEPGSSTRCKTIPHVLLDTGSTGLRLFASQINASPAISLPAQRIGGAALSQCAQFLTMQSWGTVHLADVVMGGERAPAVPIQLIDANYATLPDDCATAPRLSTSNSATTVELDANGILGTGLFDNDGQIYFSCNPPTLTCPPTSVPTQQQVRNPVGLFAVNNNGVTVQLPAIPGTGVSRAEGYLIFGVGTQANNQLGNAHVVPVNSSGYFNTVYKSANLRGFFDTGSNGLYFDDASLQATPCTRADPGFYCPPATQALSARVQLAGSSVLVNFSVASADSLFTGGRYGFNNLGGGFGGLYFDWGLPFFYGRTVHTVMERKTAPTPGGVVAGPWHAFGN